MDDKIVISEVQRKPDINSPVTHTTIKEVNGKRVTYTEQHVKKGVDLAVASAIDITPRKADQASNLKALTKNGMSKQEAAVRCGVSYSYATKLIRE